MPVTSRRRSTRARRQTVPYIDPESLRRLAAAGVEKEADPADDDSDDEPASDDEAMAGGSDVADSDSDSDASDDELAQLQAARAKRRQKSRAPARRSKATASAKRSDGDEGSTPAPKASKKKKKSRRGGLEAVLERGTALVGVVKSWIGEWDGGDGGVAACADLFNLIFKMAGNKSDVFDETVDILSMSTDDLADRVDDAQDIDSNKDAKYLLYLHGGRVGRRPIEATKQRFVELWKAIVEHAYQQDSLMDERQLLLRLVDVLTALSTSTRTSVRHLSTLAALSVLYAVAGIGRRLSSELEKVSEQVARKERERGAQRSLQAIRASEQAMSDKVKVLEEAVRNIHDGIYNKRFRDVRPAIRGDGLELWSASLAAWPTFLVRNEKTKYIAWLLHDRDASVRACALLALARLFRQPPGVVDKPLSDLNARFSERIRQCLGDKDSRVVAAALASLQAALDHSVLVQDDVEAIEQVACTHPDLAVRRAAGKFLLAQMPCFGETLDEAEAEATGGDPAASRSALAMRQVQQLVVVADRVRTLIAEVELRNMGLVGTAVSPEDQDEHIESLAGAIVKDTDTVALLASAVWGQPGAECLFEWQTVCDMLEADAVEDDQEEEQPEEEDPEADFKGFTTDRSEFCLRLLETAATLCAGQGEDAAIAPAGSASQREAMSRALVQALPGLFTRYATSDGAMASLAHIVPCVDLQALGTDATMRQPLKRLAKALASAVERTSSDREALSAAAGALAEMMHPESGLSPASQREVEGAVRSAARAVLKRLETLAAGAEGRLAQAAAAGEGGEDEAVSAALRRLEALCRDCWPAVRGLDGLATPEVEDGDSLGARSAEAKRASSCALTAGDVTVGWAVALLLRVSGDATRRVAEVTRTLREDAEDASGVVDASTAANMSCLLSQQALRVVGAVLDGRVSDLRELAEQSAEEVEDDEEEAAAGGGEQEGKASDSDGDGDGDGDDDEQEGAAAGGKGSKALSELEDRSAAARQLHHRLEFRLRSLAQAAQAALALSASTRSGAFHGLLQVALRPGVAGVAESLGGVARSLAGTKGTRLAAVSISHASRRLQGAVVGAVRALMRSRESLLDDYVSAERAAGALDEAELTRVRRAATDMSVNDPNLESVSCVEVLRRPFVTAVREHAASMPVPAEVMGLEGELLSKAEVQELREEVLEDVPKEARDAHVRSDITELLVPLSIYAGFVDPTGTVAGLVLELGAAGSRGGSAADLSPAVAAELGFVSKSLVKHLKGLGVGVYLQASLSALTTVSEELSRLNQAMDDAWESTRNDASDAAEAVRSHASKVADDAISHLEVVARALSLPVGVGKAKKTEVRLALVQMLQRGARTALTPAAGEELDEGAAPATLPLLRALAPFANQVQKQTLRKLVLPTFMEAVESLPAAAKDAIGASPDAAKEWAHAATFRLSLEAGSFASRAPASTKRGRASKSRRKSTASAAASAGAAGAAVDDDDDDDDEAGMSRVSSAPRGSLGLSGGRRGAVSDNEEEDEGADDDEEDDEDDELSARRTSASYRDTLESAQRAGEELASSVGKKRGRGSRGRTSGAAAGDGLARRQGGSRRRR